MTHVRDQLPALFGFAPADAEARAFFPAAAALALACFALPLCLLFPVDTDRTLPLLLVPAVWLGWKLSRPAPVALLLLVAWSFGAILLSTACAAYPARALVAASVTLWIFGGAMVARNLSASLPSARLVLGGILAGAVLGDLLMLAKAGPANTLCPLYTHPRLLGMHQFVGAAAGLGLLALLPGRKLARVLAALATAGCFVSLASSGSRAAMGGIAVLIVCWLWRGGAKDRRFLGLAVPAFVLIAVAASWLIGTRGLSMGLWAAVERTAASTSLEDMSSARSSFWRVVWAQGWNSPWLGHGSDAYLYIQPRLHGSQPHNVLLQWFYEHGLFGLVPLLALLVWSGLGVLFREPEASDAGRASFRAWAPCAVAGAAAYGLLDGVFYHLFGFLPLALFAGFSLGLYPGRGTLRPVTELHRFLRPTLLAALLMLLLHGWLGLMLLRGAAVEPESPPARILRHFPSTTHGLQNWLARWEKTRPDVALEWIKWAETASFQQPEFHLAAVQFYFRRHDFVSAEQELRQCLVKVTESEIPDVQRLLDDVAKKAREQIAAARPGPALPPESSPAPGTDSP